MGGGKGGFDKSNQSEAKAEQKMRDAEAQIRDSDTEHMFIFDKNGNILHKIDGSGESVEYDDKANELIRDGQAYGFMHNHPTANIYGEQIEDTPFAVDDIRDMVLAKSNIEYVVGKNMTYMMRRLQDPNVNKSGSGHSLFGGNKSPWKKDRSDFAKDYANFKSKAENRAFQITENLCRSGRLPMTDEAYVKHSVNLYVNMCKKWLSNHSKDYGYEWSEYRRR